MTSTKRPAARQRTVTCGKCDKREKVSAVLAPVRLTRTDKETTYVCDDCLQQTHFRRQCEDAIFAAAYSQVGGIAEVREFQEDGTQTLSHQITLKFKCPAAAELFQGLLQKATRLVKEGSVRV
jgi:hypothetical protein